MDSAAFNLPSEATAVIREIAAYKAQRCQAEFRMVDPPTEEEDIKMLGEEEAIHLGRHLRELQEMELGLFCTLYTTAFTDGYLHALRTFKLHSLIGDYLESEDDGDMAPPQPHNSPDSSKDVLGDFLRSMGVDPDNLDTGKQG